MPRQVHIIPLSVSAYIVAPMVVVNTPTHSLRWLALMEMHLYVAMALQLFDMQLLGPLPSTVSLHRDCGPRGSSHFSPSPISPISLLSHLQSGLHLIGVQQPKDSCLVTYRRQE